MPNTVNARTKRRHRAAGYKTTRDASLAQRVVADSALPATGAPLPTGAPPAAEGRTAQLQRLELDVAHLRHRLHEASLGGDLVHERALRRQIATSEDLLRKALADSPGLEATGELMPRAAVEHLLFSLGFCVNAALRAAHAARATLLANARTPTEVHLILGECREAAIPAGLVAMSGCYVSKYPVPQWAFEAAAHHWCGANDKRIQWMDHSRSIAVELVAKLVSEIENEPKPEEPRPEPAPKAEEAK